MYDLKKFHPIQMVNLIRLGNDCDGGYVVSKEQIQKTETLLSFGIGNDWSFETDFEKQKHIKIFAFDYSVSWKFKMGEIRDNIGRALGGLLVLRRSWIKSAIKQVKYILHNYKTLKKFFTQKQDRYFIGKYINNFNDSKNITFESIFKKLDADELSIFLKMDIEGAEYKTLPQLLPYFGKINGMVIEFHIPLRPNDLYPFEEVTQLLLDHFEVTHIHANNTSRPIINTFLPTFLEITFINKKMITKKKTKSTSKYPIDGLDFPNKKGYDDIILPYNYTDDMDKIVFPFEQYEKK